MYEFCNTYLYDNWLIILHMRLSSYRCGLSSFISVMIMMHTLSYHHTYVVIMLHNVVIMLHNVVIMLHIVVIMLHNMVIMLHDMVIMVHKVVIILHMWLSCYIKWPTVGDIFFFEKINAVIDETTLFFMSKYVRSPLKSLKIRGPCIIVTSSKKIVSLITFFALKNRAVSYISACTTMRGNTVGYCHA